MEVSCTYLKINNQNIEYNSIISSFLNFIKPKKEFAFFIVEHENVKKYAIIHQFSYFVVFILNMLTHTLVLNMCIITLDSFFTFSVFGEKIKTFPRDGIMYSFFLKIFIEALSIYISLKIYICLYILYHIHLFERYRNHGECAELKAFFKKDFYSNIQLSLIIFCIFYLYKFYKLYKVCVCFDHYEEYRKTLMSLILLNSLNNVAQSLSR